MALIIQFRGCDQRIMKDKCVCSTCGCLSELISYLYRILGYTREEIPGTNYRVLMDAENAKKALQAFNICKTSGGDRCRLPASPAGRERLPAITGMDSIVTTP